MNAASSGPAPYVAVSLIERLLILFTGYLIGVDAVPAAFVTGALALGFKVVKDVLREDYDRYVNEVETRERMARINGERYDDDWT